MSQGRQPLYFPLLDAPSPPGIRNLQKWIESAWKEGNLFFLVSRYRLRVCSLKILLGFDPDGHKEMKKLAGTRKWIGTVGKIGGFLPMSPHF